jgi:hypothetical protein
VFLSLQLIRSSTTDFSMSNLDVTIESGYM